MKLVRFKVLIFILLLPFFAFAGDSAEPEVYLHEEARVFLKYMLSAHGKSDEEKVAAFDNSYRFLEHYWSLNSGDKKAKDINEFVELTHRQHPIFLDMGREMEFFNNLEGVRRYNVDTSNGLAEDVKKYRRRQVQLVQKYFSMAKLGGNDLAKVLFEGLEQSFQDIDGLNGKGSQLLKRVPLKSITDQHKLVLVNSFERMYQRLFDEVRDIGDRVSETMGEKGNRAVTRSVQLLISTYFQEETDDGIRNMIGGLLDQPDIEDPLESFAIILQYATPQLLKLLQIVARQRGLGEGVADVLKELESKVQGAAWPSVERLIRAELADIEAAGITFDLETDVDKEQMAAGTVAQIHSGKIKVMGENGKMEEHEVVFGPIKPGIRERTEIGEKIFHRVAKKLDSDPELNSLNVPKTGPVVEDLSENIRADLDVWGRMERQNIARRLYQFERRVKTKEGVVLLKFVVPRVYYAKRGGNLMIVEKVKGDKLLKIHKRDPEAAQAIAGTMGIEWMDQAFFGEGFFHADMHPGNFMADESEGGPKKFLKKAPVKTYTINILDFGMGGVIKHFYRRYVFGMMVAALANDYDLLIDMAWEARDQDRTKFQTKEEFKEAFNQRRAAAEQLSAMNGSSGGLVSVVNSIMETGIKFDPLMAGMMRGLGVHQLLSLAVDGDADVEKKVYRLLKERPWRLFKLLRPGGLVPARPKWKLLGLAAKRLKEKFFGASACEAIVNPKN